MASFKKFLKDEAGAVTIDWVALTAGILLLGIAIVTFIFSNGVDPLVGQINDKLKSDAMASWTPDGAADGGTGGATDGTTTDGTTGG